MIEGVSTNRLNPGLVFLRNETIDFENGEQVYFSPFEAFIRASVAEKRSFRFIIPVSDTSAKFADSIVDANVIKIRSTRGILRGSCAIPELIGTLLALRRREKINLVVARVPEHLNFLLLPLLWMLGFQILIWLVHDRQKVEHANRAQRAGVRARLSHLVSVLIGVVESRFLARTPTVSNGERLAKRYCRNNNNVRVVYSTLVTTLERDEISAYSRDYRYNPHELTIVYAGRVSVEKGIDRLIDFFEALRRASLDRNVRCRCVIAGKVDDTMRDYLSSRLSAAEGRADVTVVGFVKRGIALWKIFAESDFLCLLSVAEGTPRIVPEAFACGLPVVISDDANSDSVVGDQMLKLQNDDISGLAERVLSKFLDRQEYLRARAQVLSQSKNYTLEGVQELFETMGREAVEQGQ